MVCMSPTSVFASHGERFEATRVRTRRLWWRPMVLNASVGHSAVIGTMSPVRHQAKLDKRLETVADAEHQAITVVQQVAHGLGHGRSAEERGDELGGAVRFVAARRSRQES